LFVFGFLGAACGFAGVLVGAGGVEFEGAQDFAGGGVDDADVEFVDEADNADSGVWAADADL
jgi:hypothetical protein